MFFRCAMGLFFFKFMFIAISEVAIHDFNVAQDDKFILSYCMSLSVLLIYQIEMVRGFTMIKRGYSKKLYK
jgi:hypothetical protein